MGTRKKGKGRGGKQPRPRKTAGCAGMEAHRERRGACDARRTEGPVPWTKEGMKTSCRGETGSTFPT
eukprot:scaffold44_cov339-Pavlova_lutheri.AAC.24